METMYNEWKDVTAKRDTPLGEVRFRLLADIIKRKVWGGDPLAVNDTPTVTLQAQFGSEENPGTIDTKRLYVVARLRLNKETVRWEVGRDVNQSWRGPRNGNISGRFHYDGGVVKWHKEWNRWDMPSALPLKQRDTLFTAIEDAANTLTVEELQLAYMCLIKQARDRLLTSGADHRALANAEYDRAHNLDAIAQGNRGAAYPPEFQAYLAREGAGDATQTKA